MRAAIVITLVLAGSAVVVAPLALEYLLRSQHQESVVRLMERPGTTSVNLSERELGDTLKLGCWLTGTVLAVAGVVLASRELRHPAAPERD